MVRRGSSLRDASNRYRMSQERLRAYIKETTGAIRENGRWKIVDQRLRQFPFYSNGEVAKPWMSLDQASEAGRYMQTVKHFLRTGDTEFLAQFGGRVFATSTAGSTRSSSTKTPSTNSIIAMRR
jgi:hypothetical protein